MRPPPSGPAEAVAGRARNAKAGALVEADDGRVVYVAGLQAWPPGVSGTRVRLWGTLEHRNAEPPRPEDMEMQAMVGTFWVLHPSGPLPWDA